MTYKIFVDGQEGTTGLKIHDYLSKIPNIEVITIESEKRKDYETRRALINEADVVFLCLPDAASRDAVAMINNNKTKIIDASTAFRTNPDWTYGLPEIHRSQRTKIQNSSRVTVPGCHATGFILAIHPLVAEEIIPRDYPMSCYALTGYSGGGKKLISEYQNSNTEQLFAPRHYALNLNHKHLPEMQLYSGLNTAPLFTPIVGNYYQGDAISIPLISRIFNKKVTASNIQELLASYYRDDRFVRVAPFDSEAYLEDGFFNLMKNNNTNYLDIFVFGHKDQILLVSRFDNLGKGASGAAIQNMNIMLGLDEETGLV
ncbi:N-acetyl-gamma-glutamyl-phosphate reductase [Paenibacillus sp. CGMCC 1.16610]|uniref:N-acetyl-gamma-glutamyl-phosphate reductase n=1 Tax=Paenibacillus anseongense TaxID=2682845 RepID=A0ABW9UHA6_9BACL|nr:MULTISPECIES: N-acetyl-gamma-glutamyl-phosphate reductase [Paenibacillus]MBA2939914.1 N-acetyl-gamma-glutamyl-phosphate reductase [Paenibacillus sp. CGMCC 1.16610]MVQ39574.1 N-acetyl-gamma-glutamyl-phosphate reductase [Paenibacillus anseongense]